MPRVKSPVSPRPALPKSNPGPKGDSNASTHARPVAKSGATIDAKSDASTDRNDEAKESTSTPASAFVAGGLTQRKQHGHALGDDDAALDPDRKSVRADPLSLSELQQPAAKSPVAIFANRLVALAEGIDAGVVHGKRLTTLVAQFPTFSFGDIDRLWGPKTEAKLAPDREAYLDALERLSQVAPDLEIPPMGQSALESARMNQLHAALHTGDNDKAVRIGRDAAALFPDSPLAPWYADPISSSNEAAAAKTSALGTTFEALADEIKRGTLDGPAVQTAVDNLEIPADVGPQELKAAFMPLAEVAPDVVIFGDQTLKEASLYAEILDTQLSGDSKTLAAKVEAFGTLFPDSDRTAWLTTVVLDG